jgi:DNA-directed RNA polymerase specialized sigma24 family protein
LSRTAPACDWLPRRSVRQQPVHDLLTNCSEATAEPEFTADDAEEIHRALDELDFVHREVLVLQFLEDLSIPDIAAVIGCTGRGWTCSRK